MATDRSEIINWWLKKDPLTKVEQIKLNYTRPTEIKLNTTRYVNIINKYFDLMPFCNISSVTHKIVVANKATDFINRLFDKHVDNETLVICSNNEHDNVVKRQLLCKNLLILNHEKDILKLRVDNVVQQAKQYKKVFLYIIGTQISQGEITPQHFFNSLKQAFIKNNIEHIFVLDDVHGMFIVPRDYSVFDYVLYTCHALIKGFDAGFLICKKTTESLGDEGYNWLENYYEALSVILKRQEKLRMFKEVLSEYFSKYLNHNDFFIERHNSAPHIFALSMKKPNFLNKEFFNKLKKEYYIQLEGLFDNSTSMVNVRFRAAQFIKEPEKLLPGLECLEGLFDILGYK